MKKGDIELMNNLQLKKEELLKDIDYCSNRIDNDFNELFEINKQGFHIYTKINIGDKVVYKTKVKRKEVLKIGYFSGFYKSSITRAYNFDLSDDQGKIFFTDLIQIGIEEMNRFSKVFKLNL